MQGAKNPILLGRDFFPADHKKFQSSRVARKFAELSRKGEKEEGGRREGEMQ